MDERDQDMLTGLLSRRAFDEHVDVAMNDAHAQGRPLSVAHVDPDRLFNINQDYGWQLGDEWLINFAAMARRCVRASDLIARYSGGEFAILMPGTDAQGAQAILRGLCDAVSSTPFCGANGKTIAATVSIGIAQLQPETVGARDLMLQAFAAKRDAKQCGGNCVRVANHASG